jgi:HPt (histidine-containing phosphotransfer) domain-containing protein
VPALQITLLLLALTDMKHIDKISEPYSVTLVAAALMLTPQELKPILDVFFKSASVKIVELREALSSDDLLRFSRSMHALKGLSLSLHMTLIGNLASNAELTDLQPKNALPEIVNRLEDELRKIKSIVDEYYCQAN